MEHGTADTCTQTPTVPARVKRVKRSGMSGFTCQWPSRIGSSSDPVVHRKQLAQSAAAREYGERVPVSVCVCVWLCLWVICMHNAASADCPVRCTDEVVCSAACIQCYCLLNITPRSTSKRTFWNVGPQHGHTRSSDRAAHTNDNVKMRAFCSGDGYFIHQTFPFCSRW